MSVYPSCKGPTIEIEHYRERVLRCRWLIEAFLARILDLLLGELRR